MPRTWNEGFDFYIVPFEDGPASVFLDMAAASRAPLASHPIRLILRIRMKEPDETGLRSEDEAQVLFRIEDALLTVLRPQDAIFVGRIIADGNCDLFFYLPPQATAETLQPLIDAATPDYDTTLSVAPDSEWKTYFEVLYPDQIDRQSIINRHACERLHESGDRHELERKIDHAALFPDERSAQEGGTRLTGAGFAVEAPSAPPRGGGHQMWRMQFHRVDALGDGRIDEVTVEILELLEGTGAHYDGWGCQPVAAMA